MFQAQVNWFESVRQWLEWLWKSCWKMTADFLTSAWALGVIVAGLVWSFAHWVGAACTSLVATIDGIVFPTIGHGGGYLTQALALGNTFLPIQEMLAFAVGYAVLMLTLTVYRLVKSWIPTLS